MTHESRRPAADGRRGSLAPYAWPVIPEGDPPQFRAHRDPVTGAWTPGKPSDASSYHTGCMVTQGRAAKAAFLLFADQATDGSDCRAEIGREGEPCRVCAERNDQWAERVREVRLAMIETFA